MTSTEIAAATNIMLGTTQAQAMYIGSTLLWQAQQQQQELPAGYTRLAYIASTQAGGQYINLGSTLCETVGNVITVQTKFMILGKGSDNQELSGIIISRDVNNDPYQGFSFRIKSMSSQIECNRSKMTNIENFLGTIYTEDVFDTAGSDFTVGTVQTAHQVNTTLFCSLDSNGDPFRFCWGWIQYLKIKKNGTLVADLVAAKNNSNVAGLYDMVSGTFYTSQSSTPFVGVEYSGLPSGYSELYSISSTSSGGQYIDLNIKLYEATPNFDFKMKFRLVGNGSDNSSQATMFSCQYNASPYPGLFVRRYQSAVQCKLGNGNNSSIGNTGSGVSRIYEYDYDESLGYNDKNTTHSTGTTLFCFTDTNGTYGRFANGTVYYFKLWQNGSLVRNMIPCINPNNVVGMYDLANGVFYTTPSTDPFEAGPVL